MTFPILGGNTGIAAYEIDNSLRFNDDDSAKLQRTPSSDGNKRVWTISTWLKRSKLGALQTFFGAGSSSPDTLIKLTPDDEFEISRYSGGYTWQVTSSNKLRDSSAWYHLVGAVDTTQGTASNRVKLYINGVQVSSFTNSSYPSQNFDTELNDTSRPTKLGTHPGDTQYYDGYMTETHFVDGSQLAPTDFGEFDDNGVWIPKQYTGSYGTNGFFMQFKQTGTSQNSSGIGADTSGNDNHFAVTNLASTDITEDTCTNNFCTFTPIDTPETNPTLSEGNVKLATQASPAYTFDVASFGLQQGKWYWEIKCSGAYDDDYHMVGIASTQPTAHNQELGYFTNDYGLYGGGGVNSLRYGATFYSYGNAITNNDIVGVALDLDNNRLYFSINGTFQNSSDPANGTNPISITDPSSTDRGFYFPAVCFLDGSNSATYEGNWGNPSFSISSGNNDGLYGNFEYSVPSGYYALCTKRLAEFG